MQQIYTYHVNGNRYYVNFVQYLMRMLRWMSGVTKLDRIRDETIRGTTKVGEISKKVQERRLKWYGHVLRRQDHVGERVVVMKERKNKVKDNIKNDLSERELSWEEAQDLVQWRRLIRNIDHT